MVFLLFLAAAGGEEKVVSAAYRYLGARLKLR